MLEALIRHQLSAGLPDLHGAVAAATVPIGAKLLNELVSGALPDGGPVREVVVRPGDTGEIAVDLRVSKGPIDLPVSVTMVIDSQPALPHRPVLGLRLTKVPFLLTLGRSLFSVADLLPPGISLQGDRIEIDLATLLTRHGAGDLLRYLQSLRVTTRPGALILDVQAAVGTTRP